MIDLSLKNEWQHICPDTGLIMPWYTKPALDEIVTWDLKDKVVFEYGCGASTLWWAAKCKKLYGVESDIRYFSAVCEKVGNIAAISHTLQPYEYSTAVRQWMKDYDIVVIDGILREECVFPSLECLKPGGVLIYDNWMQPSAEIQCELIKQTILAMPHKIYKQEGHPDWQTLIAWKPKEITDIKITEVSLLQNGEYGIGYTHKHTD